jgi:hypothetical protein
MIPAKQNWKILPKIQKSKIVVGNSIAGFSKLTN